MNDDTLTLDIHNTEAQNTEEESLITSLRAQSFAEFHGQQRVKESLQIAIEAARQREESIEHILLYGPPGLGKTTLSHIIAREMGTNIRVTSGPAIERAGDLASILTNLQHGDVLFIDEIHRMNKTVEETLYPAMEDYCLDIVIGKGPSARTLRLDLPQFTIIGATTRVGLLSAPLRDRFGVVHRLELYTPKELKIVVSNAAKKLEIMADDASLNLIAARSRGTPRIGLKILKRVRDYAQVKGQGEITEPVTTEALELLQIDDKGLDPVDKQYLNALISKHQGGPVGLDTISSTISEDPGTVEDVIEPYLLQLGLIQRTPRGRVATQHAYQHLGAAIPENTQQKLI